MNRIKNGLLILIFLCCPAILSGQTADGVKIPAVGDDPVRLEPDGKFDEEVWQKAFSSTIGDSVEMLIFQDESRLFIGVKSNSKSKKTITDLFISAPGMRQLNLHASMQLGERFIKDCSWDVSVNPWKWGNNEKWTSNVITYDKSKDKDLPMIYKFTDFEGQEFVISKEKIAGDSFSLRLEIVVFLENGTAKLEYPPNTNSGPSTWLNLRL